MCIAEILGTAILIFLGCMGAIGTLGPTPPPQFQSAMTFGMTVNLIIMVSNSFYSLYFLKKNQ